MSETWGNTLKMLKNTSHNHCQCLLLYNLAEQWTSGLGRFLECQKYNILVITQALMLCLIYTYALRRLVYVSGKALLPVL